MIRCTVMGLECNSVCCDTGWYTNGCAFEYYYAWARLLGASILCDSFRQLALQLSSVIVDIWISWYPFPHCVFVAFTWLQIRPLRSHLNKSRASRACNTLFPWPLSQGDISMWKQFHTTKGNTWGPSHKIMASSTYPLKWVYLIYAHVLMVMMVSIGKPIRTLTITHLLALTNPVPTNSSLTLARSSNGQFSCHINWSNNTRGKGKATAH